MSDAISERNIRRYQPKQYYFIEDKDATRFCLAQVRAYQSEDQTINDKVDDLVASCNTLESQRRTQLECTIGGCTLKIEENVENGRQISGLCKATSYCLKSAFEAVGKADTTEEGRKRYREIMDSLEGHVDKYNAGNFCPRINCGLSAGVSIDGVAGTAGECSQQPELPINIDASVAAGTEVFS